MSGMPIFYVENYETGEFQKVRNPNKDCVYQKQDSDEFFQVGFSYLVLARSIKTTDPIKLSEALFDNKINFLKNQSSSNHLRVGLFCIGFEYLLHALFLKENQTIQDSEKKVFNLSDYYAVTRMDKSKIASLDLANQKKKHLWLATKKVTELRSIFLHKINKELSYTENITWEVIDKGMRVLWDCFDKLASLEPPIYYRDVLLKNGE